MRTHVTKWALAGYVEEHVGKLPGQRRIKHVVEYEIEFAIRFGERLVVESSQAQIAKSAA